MFDLAKRNLILFFRDTFTVLLSFLAEVIVVILYFLFIRDNLLEQFSYLEHAEILMDVWMIAGVLGITSVTTTMGAYGIMVEDRAKGLWKDFLIAPIKRGTMVGGYMIAAIIIGVIMSMLVLLMAGIYMRQIHDVKLLMGNGEVVLGLIFLSAVSNSSMVIFLISFLKSSNALASCSTIIGSLIGFLTGIYLPMGNLPEYVQMVVRAFPLSHGVVLFRQSLMESFLADCFGGAKEELEVFVTFMGIQFSHEEKIVTMQSSVVLLWVCSLFFGVLTMLRMEQMKER